MAVKFLKLGFDKRVLRQESFKNLYLNDNKVGFNLGIRLNYYRGQHLSTIERLDVKVDGELIAQDLILFCINDKKFTIPQLKDLFAEFWAFRKTANLEIYNGGLSEGEHDIELILELRIPYMKFAPRTYGSLNSTVHKTMVLTNN
ncbi:MAG: DUF6379 domain-containing protein [Flectobacillus sp.]|nr:DUF6379 domain-containing protein [Flectobacillus sp.]